MPTHALLGATGATGSAILRHLLANPPPDLTLKIFIRNKDKLLQTFPNLASTTALNIQITEAPLTDTAALQACLQNAETIHQCIATNDAAPGTHVAQDVASALVSALEALRAQHQQQQQQQNPQTYQPPTLLILRSASLNPFFEAHTPRLQNALVHFCLQSVYADLSAAAALYARVARERPGLFDYIFVDPGALHDARGTEAYGHVLVVDSPLPRGVIGYSDLGAGFVEIAGRKGEFKGLGVGVDSTGRVNTEWGTLAWYNLRGVYGRVTGW